MHEYINKNMNCICKYCNSEFKGGKRSKYCCKKCAAQDRVKNENYIQKLSQAAKNTKGKRPLHTLETKNKIKKALKGHVVSDITKEKMSASQKSHKGFPAWNKNKLLSEEHKRKISINNKGGRCSWYEIEKPNGDKIKIQGSYELRFVKILNNIDKDWIKPSIWNREHQFQWFDKNEKSHWYTPDFWSPKLQKYFELKGFWKKDDEEKKKFVDSLKNVEIIYLQDLEKYEKNLITGIV